MNKKVIIPVVIVAAFLYMNKKPATKKNPWLYLDAPETAQTADTGDLFDFTTPEDTPTPSGVGYKRNWINSL